MRPPQLRTWAVHRSHPKVVQSWTGPWDTPTPWDRAHFSLPQQQIFHFFWVQHINNSALNLHRKSHKITSKGSWVIWERVYFGAQNNFLDSFPRLLCIADGINLIFKCRIQWKALDTLNICKNSDGNRARFHEDMEKTVKSGLRKPRWRPKFGNCIPSLQYFSSAQFESRPIDFRNWYMP